MNPKSRLNSQHAIKYIATTHILLQKTYCYTVAVFYRESIFVWLFFLDFLFHAVVSFLVMPKQN